MARFKIYSKDGQSVRYEGKPKYLGVYLNPSCLKFSEISSSEPIAWEVGDYVDYPRTGMRYRLYSIPQPSKEARRGSYGGAFRYSGVELYAATKELEIALFRDLVGNDNNIHFSTSPDVTTFENVYGIARRIQACMDDLYPGRWEIRVADFDADADAEILEKLSEAKDFALSGGTCLDALSKIYELWQDTGWIHSYENGKEVITIGYTNKRIDSNTSDSYLYGKGNGLTAIKKTQTNGEEFATRLYVYGSEHNIPPRYYNGLDILNAESVDIRNLMLPPDTWGQTDNLPDARKAYLENAEAVAKFGVIPKTHYFDSEDAGADIYPTIERLTIGEIRNAMSPDDDYYPSESYADTDRADAVLSAENPSDDGVINPNGKEYDAKAYLSIQSIDKTVNMVGGVRESPLLTDHPLFSKTIETDFSRGKVVVDLSQTIAIPDKGFSSVVARVTIGDDEQAGYGTAVGSNAFPAVLSEDGKNWEIKLGRISAEYGKSELYDNTEYNVYGHVSITANTVGVESSEIKIVFRPGSGSIGIKRILDKTFRLNLKQIGFDINEQASLGKGKTISMKTGACAGRNFVISDCFYSSAYDSWVLTCKRQQDDTLGMLFPNNAYEIADGDTFVLVDIAMPSLYISVAMNRLFSVGQKFLARASKIQSHYEPSIDAKVMTESGRTLREGMFMEITDEDVVDNTTDYILIDTLSISEDESAIPTYKVTLRERRKVTYKGTPSATSATETKSVEDETEVQPNVDLTGYAKETYVNDKVSEVNNLLASMWTIDEETGDLVTDRNVRIAKNVIIGGDTSTGGTGQDVPSGIDEAQLKEYLDTNKYITSDYAYSKEEVNRLIDEVNAGDIDLTNYYTKEETASEISNAIAGIEIPSLDGYATEQFVTDSITALNVGQYATKASLETLQGEVDNIEAVLGMDEEAEGIINTWNEVKAFLDGYSSSDDLAAILSGMNADIATRALGSDLDALAARVGVNESAISDNATNIRNAKGEIDSLKDTKADWGTTLAHYGITDAYTKNDLAAYKTWWDNLMSLIVKEGSNVRIKTNLIIDGDQSAICEGGGAVSGITGIAVNGQTYTDTNNDGIIDLGTITSGLSTVSWTDVQGRPTKLSQFANDPGFVTGTDVNTALAGYLPLTGGVIKKGSTTAPLEIASDSTIEVGLRVRMDTSNKGWFGYNSTRGTLMYNHSSQKFIGIKDDGTPHFDGKTLYHTGNFNPANYLPLSGGKLESARTDVLTLNSKSLSTNGVYLKMEHNAVKVGEFGCGWGLGTYMLNGDNYLAVKDNGKPYYNANLILHEGNYSSYALPKSGGTITGVLTINTSRDKSLVFDEPTGEKYHVISFAANGKEYANLSANYIGNENSLWFNDYKILHSGNIGSYNAGSATKLATARTIWGQSFDGTGNVDGILTLNYANTSRATGVEVISTTGGEASIGFKLDETNRAAVGVWSTALNLWTQTKKTAISIPIATGNVLIGITTDLGYKLDVDGAVRSKSIIINRSSDNAPAYYISEGSSESLEIRTAGGSVPIVFNTNYNGAGERMRIAGNGNVIIGGGDLAGSEKLHIASNDAKIDAMVYASRSTLSNKIGFGIGTSGNRGIYDKDLGWVFQITTDNKLNIGTLSGTLYSTANQGFNVTRTSDWAYYQLKSGSVAWDIATTATAASSNIKQANALEFRFNGGGDWGFSLRPNTSSFGVGVLVSNAGECSLGFLSSSSSSSDKKPQWLIGTAGVSSLFGVYNTARSKYGFTVDDYFTLSSNSITIRGESGSYINNRAVLVLNSASKQAADIVFKCNSSTKGNYGQWAISSRSENDGRFSIFRGSENIAVASEEELFTIKANGDVRIAKNLIVQGDISA